MMMLKQQVAIVTAGAEGMGAEFARAMATAGAIVAIADHRDARALAREIEERGGRAMALTADLTDEAQALAMTRTVADHFGRVDILVNAASCHMTHPAAFTDIAIAEWDRVVSASLRSIFVCARATVPFMRRSHCGRIVNICPPAGGEEATGLHLATAGGAIMALTHALARELCGTGIGVYAVAHPADLLKPAPVPPRTPGAQALH